MDEIRDALTALIADLQLLAGKPALLDRARLDGLEERLAAIGVQFRVAERQAAHWLADLATAIRRLSAPYLAPVAKPHRSLPLRLFSRPGVAMQEPVAPLVFQTRAWQLAADIAALLSVLQTQKRFLDDVLPPCEALAETLRDRDVGDKKFEAKRDPVLFAGRQELTHDLIDLVIDMTASCNILSNLLTMETEAFVLLVAGVDATLLTDIERDLPALQPHLQQWQAGLLSVRHIDARRTHLAEVYHHRFGGARQAASASLPEGR
jgi:hypothetical protein